MVARKGEHCGGLVMGGGENWRNAVRHGKSQDVARHASMCQDLVGGRPEQ